MVVFANPFTPQFANERRVLAKLMRPHASADPVLRFHDPDIPSSFGQAVGGCEAGKAGPQHDATTTFSRQRRWNSPRSLHAFPALRLVFPRHDPAYGQNFFKARIDGAKK